METNGEKWPVLAKLKGKIKSSEKLTKVAKSGKEYMATITYLRPIGSHI